MGVGVAVGVGVGFVVELDGEGLGVAAGVVRTDGVGLGSSPSDVDRPEISPRITIAPTTRPIMSAPTTNPTTINGDLLRAGRDESSYGPDTNGAGAAGGVYATVGGGLTTGEVTGGKGVI